MVEADATNPIQNEADTTRQRAFLDHLASDFNRNKLVFVGEAAFFTNRCCWQCQALVSFLIWYAPSSTWTGKLHLDCHFRMQNMISWKMARWKGDTEPRERKVKVHSVLHCTNSECHGMTVNRHECCAKHAPVAARSMPRTRETHLLQKRHTSD
ncbi:hypothetical protein EDD86DRAFT_15489 [Gorgonomyces haynaldii]|nr:hypothetical protein EDD86DRAFT_15489 [Gorgonomyces haynaldii]